MWGYFRWLWGTWAVPSFLVSFGWRECGFWSGWIQGMMDPPSCSRRGGKQNLWSVGVCDEGPCHYIEGETEAPMEMYLPKVTWKSPLDTSLTPGSSPRLIYQSRDSGRLYWIVSSFWTCDIMRAWCWVSSFWTCDIMRAWCWVQGRARRTQTSSGTLFWQCWAICIFRSSIWSAFKPCSFIS